MVHVGGQKHSLVSMGGSSKRDKPELGPGRPFTCVVMATSLSSAVLHVCVDKGLIMMIAPQKNPDPPPDPPPTPSGQRCCVQVKSNRASPPEEDARWRFNNLPNNIISKLASIVSSGLLSATKPDSLPRTESFGETGASKKVTSGAEKTRKTEICQTTNYGITEIENVKTPEVETACFVLGSSKRRGRRGGGGWNITPTDRREASLSS